MKGHILAIFLLTSIPLLFFSNTLGAATVLKMDIHALVSQSDTIVIGEVTSLEARQAGDGRVYTTIDVRVDEAVKGNPAKTLRLRQVGGRDREADIATYVPGMPHFEAQERVFLFISQGQEYSVVTGMAQGKFHIALGPDSTTEYVIPELQDLNLITGDRRPELDRDRLDERHAHLFERVHEFDSFRLEVQALVDADGKGK